MRRSYNAATLAVAQNGWRWLALAYMFSRMNDNTAHNPFAEILRAAALRDAPAVTVRRRGRKPERPTGHVGSASELSSLLPASMRANEPPAQDDDTEPPAQATSDKNAALAAAGVQPEVAIEVLEVVAPLGDLRARDLQKVARGLYFQGYRSDAICAMLDITRAQFKTWKSRYKWDSLSPLVRVEQAAEMRLMALISLQQKTAGDFKEIDLLTRQMERFARIGKYNETGKEADLNPNIQNRIDGSLKWHEKRRAKEAATPGLKGATIISEEQADVMRDALHSELFDYQRTWLEAGKQHRIRHILKSRQIGATYYFAREALIDAIDTGRNQIFLSASKAQAHVFKHYMQQLASTADVELKGEVIRLQNGAHLYFLGTNSKTAQSYHGNLYFDEIFWVGRFQELRKVASGMAMHKKWRQTYFSTPSSITHEAYPFWKGDLFNVGKATADRVEIDTSHTALAGGKLCADGQWRQIVTVEDAMRGGCDLFDIEQLRLEYGADEYANLLMCEFVDDTDSVFPFSLVSRCMVDSWDAWAKDYKPFATRPLGDKAVWIGYDPSLSGDGAGLCVVAPPDKVGGKFRVLERHTYKGVDFAGQAHAIRTMTARYNVEHIAIDASGLGSGVYELVRSFFPAAVALRYDIELKTKMVLKAHDVMSKGRLEFDAGCKDVAAAFMAIRRSVTNSGQQITYKAGRNEQTGHADLAWAVMHVLINEPLSGNAQSAASTVEFFD